MSSDEPTRPDPPAVPPGVLAPSVAAALFVEHVETLRRVVWGILRNDAQTQDVIQAAFAKLLELGHTVQEPSLRAWLFRVAINEAFVFKRRESVARRALPELEARHASVRDVPGAELVRWETVARVRRAIGLLPVEQQEVVRLRIFEQRKFHEIAAELQLPLGTVLTRMQLALKKLKRELDDRAG